MCPTQGHTALLVIDVQDGCFSLPGVRIHEPGVLLSRVGKLVSGARTAGVPVVYTQQIGPPGHVLATGSEGGRIHAAVAPRDGELVIQKRQSDGFLETDLHAALGELDIKDLVVCGMQSEFCVDTTCRRAQGLGYRVFLVQDAHTTAAAGALSAEQIIEHHNQTLGGPYATLCRAADVFA